MTETETQSFIPWCALIIAALALLQPHLIAAYKKWLQKGRVDVHETYHIIIGYSFYGPTLQLNGTLRSRDRDVFVTKIELTVTKRCDSSVHRFAWSAFWSPKIDAAGNPEEAGEIASGFLLRREEPKRYNTMFADVQTQDEIVRFILKVKQEWNTVLGNQEISDIGGIIPVDFPAFSAREDVSNAVSEIERRCYWDAGTYLLDMQVFTSSPDRNFSRKWRFDIREEDSTLLRQNALLLLLKACNQTDSAYNFAYAEYQAVSEQ